LLATIAGLLGDFFLSETNIAGPVNIAIVDLDDGFETRLILSVITDQADDYTEMLRFSHKTLENAETSLRNGNISAIITLPENFGASMTSGENIPFTVTYNAERPLSATLIQVMAEAFADMLRTSQMGVYVTLNYVLEQGVPPESFDMIFMGVNMRFLGFVIARGEMFIVDTTSATGGLPTWKSYFITTYIALMICAAFVMTDTIRRNFSRYCLISLKNRDVSILTTFSACIFAYFLLFSTISATLWLLIFFLPIDTFSQFDINVQFLVGVILISASLSTFAAMLTFAFDNAFSAGVFTSVFAIVSLVLSGGVIPTMYFSDTLQATSNIVWSTWSTNLLSAAILDENILTQAAMCTLFGFLFAVIGLLFVKLRGRCE